MISQVLSQGVASSGASGLVAAAFDLAKFADFWDQHPLFQAIAGAVIIGTVGSAAYLTALFLGFLGDTPLKALRPRFETIAGTPPVTRLSSLRFVAFVVFGGFVASVFQLAQGTTFAAVQALVLGATWPTVISQILTKTGETDADMIVDLANRIAGKPTS
jgi:hypothetical protein